MKIEVTQGEGLIKQLNVEVPAETVNTEMDKLFAEARKEADLKGFRKGKAPMNMIRSIYGDKVKADVADQLLQSSLQDAVRKNELKIASKPTITAIDFSDEGAFSYTAEIEVLPEIEKVAFDHLELKTEKVEVSDAEIDEVLDHYRRQQSHLRPVEREASETDVVVVDLQKIKDPILVMDQSEFTNSEIDLGNKLTVKDFREQLVGVKAGDEKDITVHYDENYSEQQIAGATITYKCKVKGINERIMPEANDEFAKRTGQAETLLELRMKIREDFTRQKEDVQRRMHRRDIVEQMCQKNAVPVPNGLLDEYLDSIVKDIKKQPDAGEIDEKEIRERYRPVGMNSIRWEMLWHTLAQQESIEVLPEDTEKWINGFAASNNITPEQAKETLNRSGKVQQLRDSMLEEKVVAFLHDRAKKVPVEK